MSEMTIVEGLKKLKRIERRMVRNNEEIQKYSSVLSTEKPIFDTEAKQREEVQKLIQSNHDLELEYCRIKARIDYTNLVIYVTIGGENRTIHSWLTLLRRTGGHLTNTYKSLSTKEAASRQGRYRDQSTGLQPQVIRLYDENLKRNGLRKWEDLISGKEIEGRLEVINATTELQIIPE
jgi:hypothetical protein